MSQSQSSVSDLLLPRCAVMHEGREAARTLSLAPLCPRGGEREHKAPACFRKGKPGLSPRVSVNKRCIISHGLSMLHFYIIAPRITKYNP